jgi:hypothetical protein
MSLLTYQDVRPHAKDIRDEVSEGHMPPWHADAPKGTFLNERGLTDDDKRVLIAWANTGALKGDPKDLPPTPIYPEGWAIGKPDVVFEMQEDYAVPAEGVTVRFYIPTNLPKPSGSRRLSSGPVPGVVHHALASTEPPDMKRAGPQPNWTQMVLPPPRSRAPAGARIEHRPASPPMPRAEPVFDPARDSAEPGDVIQCR